MQVAFLRYELRCENSLRVSEDLLSSFETMVEFQPLHTTAILTKLMQVFLSWLCQLNNADDTLMFLRSPTCINVNKDPQKNTLTCE